MRKNSWKIHAEHLQLKIHFKKWNTCFQINKKLHKSYFFISIIIYCSYHFILIFTKFIMDFVQHFEWYFLPKAEIPDTSKCNSHSKSNQIKYNKILVILSWEKRLTTPHEIWDKTESLNLNEERFLLPSNINFSWRMVFE